MQIEHFEHCSKLKPVAEAATALDRVKAVVDVLYSPGGCPWDGAQTHLSIRRNFLEEAYEACEGFDLDDPALKDRIVALKATRDQARADAERASALLLNSAQQATIALSSFSGWPELVM